MSKWNDPAHRREYNTEYMRKWRKDNPGAHRKSRNLPAATRAEPEWCECCGRYFEKAARLDHDHKTGQFRGWLCAPCNLALGLLGDTIEGLEKAVAYLKRAA